MDYISTRGQDGPLGFEQALLSGLARDGGLYLPVEWPRFSKAEIVAMKGLSMPSWRAASWLHFVMAKSAKPN